MERVTLAVVGDVSTGFEPPESAFTGVVEPLRRADLRFAQVERVYSTRREYPENTGMRHAGQHPRMATAFKSVPFDVVSIASNHTGDWGSDIVVDTVETFRELGIQTIGAGRNVEEARRPALLTRHGLRIAVLGYASVVEFPDYWATEEQPGCAPMRAHTFYEPYESQPGAAVRIVTEPRANDLANLVADVRKAKQGADLVFVSLHWGVHFTSRPCDYQVTVAHAAIDAGATAIIGHHPHQLQGIELYKGGIIFYSLGNFSFWRHAGRKKGRSYCSPEAEHTQDEVYSVEPDPGFAFRHNRHFNEGGIGYIEVDRSGIAAVRFLPTLMNEAGQAQAVRPDQPQFGEIMTYLNWAGKFIPGGITDVKLAGESYEVFARPQ